MLEVEGCWLLADIEVEVFVFKLRLLTGDCGLVADGRVRVFRR